MPDAGFAPAAELPDLRPFFAPTAVALFGPVNRRADPHTLERTLHATYGAPVHLVNPSGGSVGHIPIHTSVEGLPEEVDVGVAEVPTAAVVDVVRDCARVGIGHLLVMTVGFAELGEAGAVLQRELSEAAAELGVRLIGPNTAMNVFERMPDVPSPKGGKIALLCQSGHFGRPVVQAAQFGISFSHWVATGNEADLEVCDFIEYFCEDSETGVIAGYFEGFKDGNRLRRALGRARARNKPVVAIKIGRTEAGRRMAQSHTAHLSGSDAVLDGLFRQHAVTRVNDVDELIETAALFAKVPEVAGERLCCYSISGGSSVMMAEQASHFGFTLPTLSEQTQRELHENVPGYLTVTNPVDTGGIVFQRRPPEARRRALELLAHDPAVDLLVVSFHAPIGWINETFVEDVVAFAPDSPTPIVTIWPSFKDDVPEFKRLIDSGLPIFRSYAGAFRALRALMDLVGAEPEPRENVGTAVASEPGRILNSSDASTLAARNGIPLAPERLVTGAAEAAKTAEALGGPVAMKIASVDFPHRSDSGLVELGVSGAREVSGAFTNLMARARTANPEANIEGVLVQPMLSGRTELLVGISQDPTFGPALTVGMGGIFAEVLADVAVRPLPIIRADARRMLEELRGYPILAGARGRPPVDLVALEDLLLAVARLASDPAAKVFELDLNPVMAGPGGAVAADLLIVAG